MRRREHSSKGMPVDRVSFKVRLNRRLSHYERLLCAYALARRLEDSRGSAYVRRSLVLKAESRSRGPLLLYEELRGDPSLAPFLKSYVPVGFLDLLLYVAKSLGDVRVVTSRVAELAAGGEGGAPSHEVEISLRFSRLLGRTVSVEARGRVDSSLREEVEECLSLSPGEVEVGRGPWAGLNERQVSLLVRGLRNYSLEELYWVMVAPKPKAGRFEVRAGLDVLRYGEDLASELLRVVEWLKSKARGRRASRALRELEAELLALRGRVSYLRPDPSLVSRLVRAVVRASELARVDRRELAGLMPTPARDLVFRLWERSADDLLLGFYAGTCIALDGRRAMHEYILDPHTLFFRVYVNGRPIGHVKAFACRDEDGALVLHVDYIGLAGGKYRQLHEDIKLYSLSVVARYAEEAGYERVYVAKAVAPKVEARVVRSGLVKLGREVYAQHLGGEKLLVWERGSRDHGNPHPPEHLPELS